MASNVQRMFPNASAAWADGEGLSDASFQRGDTIQGWGRQAMRAAGTLAGLSHDINPVNKVSNWMNKNPAQSGFMQVATDVGHGVDAKGNDVVLDPREVAKQKESRGGISTPNAPSLRDTMSNIPQASQGVDFQRPFGVTTPEMSTPDSPNMDVAGMQGIPQGAGVPAPSAKPANQMDWDTMAKHLASLSQGRTQGGWQEPMQQQVTGGWNSLPDYAAQQNADFDRRHAADNLPRGISDRERARLMVQMANNQENNATQREGHQMNYAAQMAGQGVTARGQDLNYAGHMAGVGAQGQNGLMSAMSHLYGAKMASDANQGVRDSQIEYNQDRGYASRIQGKLHEQQLAELQAGKNPKALAAQNYRAILGDMFKSGMPQSPEEMVRYHLMAQAFSDPDNMENINKLAAGYAQNKKANGGVVGYADGGAIFGDDSAAGLQGRLAAMQAMNNGASVAQAYGAGVKGDLYGGWYAGEQPNRSLTGPNDSITLGGKQTTINDAISASNSRIASGVSSGVGGNRQAAVQGMFDRARPAGLPDNFNGTGFAGLNGPGSSSQPQWSGDSWRQNNASVAGNNYGYADGGSIQVGGRQVLGPGTGKSDSIPAVIDGDQPAALSTGEFVMPVEAVQHFGLDRLNKMVAQARKGLDTGR